MKIHLLKLPVIIAAAIFTGCTAQSVAEEKVASALPDPATALKESAAFYDKRGENENARKAVKTLGAARNMDSRNFRVEWTFAQYSYFLGSRPEVDDAEAEKILSKGLEAARIAKRMEPEKPDGYFWYAAILGEQSKRSPVTVGVASIGKIREAMNRVIEIEPNYQGASAYDGLGQLEMGTLGLAGGDVEKAIEYFEKAHELNSKNSYIRLHLGEAYLAAGKKADAKKHLEHVLSMGAAPGFQPEYDQAVRESKKLLSSKF